VPGRVDNSPMIPRISVALPVFSAAGTLRRAVDSIRHQTVTELEILIVLNGSDGATREVAYRAAQEESRVRVIELSTPSLPAALNVAIREARAGLIARMDADDECAPSRFERQEQFLRENRKVAVVGTAYQRRFTDGALCGVVMPPLLPEDIRWRLQLGSTMSHGSVMMRRDVLLTERGYDETCLKAQDFELWLRLSARHDIANLPEVLYTYTVRDRASFGVPSEAQSVVVANHLLAAWAHLRVAAVSDADRCAIARALVEVQLGGGRSARAVSRIERVLRADGPTRESLMAWLYATAQAHGASISVMHTCKGSRLRERGRELRALGIRRLWLWGAGRHTQWVLEHATDLNIKVEGIVDDVHSGEVRFGFVILNPGDLLAGSHVLLSSDQYEDEMWARSGALLARGVFVHGLYRADREYANETTALSREPALERVA